LAGIHADFDELSVMPLSDQAERYAIAAMRRVALRGMDALHIGTAQAASVDLFSMTGRFPENLSCKPEAPFIHQRRAEKCRASKFGWTIPSGLLNKPRRNAPGSCSDCGTSPNKHPFLSS
jgi:hypothetical protein